jgi:hypothetical protein
MYISISQESNLWLTATKSGDTSPAISHDPLSRFAFAGTEECHVAS